MFPRQQGGIKITEAQCCRVIMNQRNVRKIQGVKKILLPEFQTVKESWSEKEESPH